MDEKDLTRLLKEYGRQKCAALEEHRRSEDCLRFEDWANYLEERPETVNKFKAHILECRYCQRVRRTFRAYPELVLEKKRRPRISRNFFFMSRPAFAAILLLLVAVPVAIVFQLRTTPTLPPMSLSLLMAKSAQQDPARTLVLPEEVLPNTAIPFAPVSGDFFTVKVTLDEDTYLYSYWLQTSGRILPLSKEELPPGTHLLPSTEDLLELAGSPGTEIIVVFGLSSALSEQEKEALLEILRSYADLTQSRLDDILWYDAKDGEWSYGGQPEKSPPAEIAQLPSKMSGLRKGIQPYIVAFPHE